ncbi:MAG: hypothetical protein DWQ01_05790 [Planctomycetota bacterium]|nr:MAG: hypothetical protein DWQ01_05790 [Planctomycetota bacterium]
MKVAPGMTFSPRKFARLAIFLLALSPLVAGAPNLCHIPQTDSQESASFKVEAPPELERVAAASLPELEKVLAEAREWLFLDPNPALYPPIHLQWVLDRPAMAQALGRERVPRWYAAVAVPSQRKVIIATRPAADSRQLLVTLRHEMMHIVFSDGWSANFREIPAWFHEGCAQVFAGELYLQDMEVSLFWRALSDNLPRLIEFHDGFGEDPYMASVGYAMSEAYVRRLIRLYGEGIVRRILDVMAEGKAIDQALFETTGVNRLEHEETFRKELRSWTALMGNFQQQLFLGVTLALVVALPVIRAHRRQRRKRWEEKWDGTQHEEDTTWVDMTQGAERESSS